MITVFGSLFIFISNPDVKRLLNVKQSLLDTYLTSGYNNLCAEVAQSVEQRTENPRVPSSILGLGTIIRRK
jgi:hypothetical protein